MVYDGASYYCVDSNGMMIRDHHVRFLVEQKSAYDISSGMFLNFSQPIDIEREYYFNSSRINDQSNGVARNIIYIGNNSSSQESNDDASQTLTDEEFYNMAEQALNCYGSAYMGVYRGPYTVRVLLYCSGESVAVIFEPDFAASLYGGKLVYRVQDIKWY